MLSATITAVEYHLPDRLLSNDELAVQFPEWPAAKIEEKLGIVNRPIAADGECSSDLAVRAAEKLFSATNTSPSEIDYVLFCTQTPDYFLPTTACLIQNRLGIPKSAGALDFNLGCSGYVYGLGLAKGLIETGQARRLLLLTGETYSKLLSRDDKATRTLFGDAGSATLIEGREAHSQSIGPFVYGSDGGGSEHLILRHGAFRERSVLKGQPLLLCMNGGEIFAFGVREVANAVNKLLEQSGVSKGDVDLFVFHQANSYMLEFLRKKCDIPAERFYLHYANVGNTVSNSIPIAIHHALKDGAIKPGSKVMLVGFGVGLSWGSCFVEFR